MKYHVTIRARTCVVELHGASVIVDGVALETHWAPVPGTPLSHLLLAGESWTVAAQPLDASGAHWALGAVGERFEVDVVDDRTRQIEALTGRGRGMASGEQVVKAPMPGLVVRVEVAAGQAVEAGAALVVVEAMKMENELRAPQAGTIVRVHVAPGDRVEKATPLVTLAQPSS